MTIAPTLAIRNPRTGVNDYEITPTDSAAVATLCTQMRTAQKSWAARGLEGRLQALRDFASSIDANRAALHDALSADTGRHYIAGMEIDGIEASIERWATIAEDVTPQSGRSTALPFIRYHVDLKPLPLVGVISPWNFPLTLSLIDTIPALMAGAAVIIKPSEVTPRFAAPLREIIASVDGLSDVFKIVDGTGETGAAIVDNVDAICFTGSVATGLKVGEQAAKNFIPSFLELGGKDPAIVLEGADIDRATTALLRGSILNSGQACQSIERIYVAAPIFDAFVKSIVEKAEKVTLTTQDKNAGQLGPIIFDKQAAIIEAQMNDARDKGATIHTGGAIENHGGLWCRPTVITGLTDDMSIMTDETFGPLLPIIAFTHEDEAIAMANDSEFGLSAAVFAETAEQAVAVGRQIDAGGISINDAALTALMYEVEKDSFKMSGLGASRMGITGYMRFFKKQSFMINEADVFTIEMFDEANSKN